MSHHFFGQPMCIRAVSIHQIKTHSKNVTDFFIAFGHYISSLSIIVSSFKGYLQITLTLERDPHIPKLL